MWTSLILYDGDKLYLGRGVLSNMIHVEVNVGRQLHRSYPEAIQFIVTSCFNTGRKEMAEAAAIDIGASVVSAVLQPMVDKAASIVLEECDYVFCIKKEIDKLQHKLFLIEMVLEDAEERQLRETKIWQWLKQLKTISYDATDVLDDFVTYTAIRKRQAEEGIGQGRKVCCCIFPCFKRSCLTPLFRCRVAHRIRDIRKRLDDIARQRDILKLVKSGGIDRAVTIVDRPVVGPSVDRQQFVLLGRDKPKEEIMAKLLDPDDHVHLFPIVGMGGVGKTTLARAVFNDEKIKDEDFPVKNRRWLSVGEKFDVHELIKKIIEEPDTKDALDVLQRKLEEKYREERFLIVLDDVWTNTGWETLWNPLTGAKKGGVVIVTTRIGEVIARTNNAVPSPLKPLSYEDCLSIFEKHAFAGRNPTEQPNLRAIGQKIVEKLNGLPLAAEVVGSSLRNESDEKAWRSFLTTRDWKPNGRDEIIPALEWSYRRLPPYLKQCFAYCSVFPKDYVFDETELIRMWMAHGFVQDENYGHTYFKKLLDASFFQYTGDEEYMMHDILHDLALLVSKDESYTIKQGKVDGISESVRHISIFEADNILQDFKFQNLCNYDRLRTLIAFPNTYSDESICVPPRILRSLFAKLKCIRILALGGILNEELPDCVGDLRHLRYLDLRCNDSLRSLPESLCSLYNLQALMVPDSARLPKNMGNLINLRHLEANLQDYKGGIGTWTSIQTLPTLWISEGSGYKIAELKHLTQLRGDLEMFNLENVKSKEEALQVALQDKLYLNSLSLSWDHPESARDDVCSTDTEVLEALQPPPNITELTICGYMGRRSPDWMLEGERNLPSLHYVKLSSCSRLENLPPFPCLEELQMANCPKLSALPPLPPNLKVLDIENIGVHGCLPGIWGCSGSTHGKRSSLSEIKISDCPKLTSLGEGFLCHLSALKVLDIGGCEGLTSLTLKALPYLEKLSVKDCSNIVDIHLGVGVAESIKVIDLGRCPVLTAVAVGSATSMSISGMESRCPTALVVPCLVTLYIFGCEELVSLGFGLQDLISIEILDIRECPKLTFAAKIEEEDISLPSSSTATSPLSKLKYLTIDGNGMILEDVLQHGLKSLEEMSIGNCSINKTERWQETLAPLRKLWIWSCSNLTTLVTTTVASPAPLPVFSLEQLEELRISSCEELVALGFGLESLISIKDLCIVRCPKLKLVEGGDKGTSSSLSSSLMPPPVPSKLERMTTDDIVFIADLVQQHNHLTSSLKELHIDDFDHASFGRELQWRRLTSLAELQFLSCRNLRSLPAELATLPSLRQLVIYNCPAIQSLPDDGLPLSLQELRISGCPVLVERCQKEGGPDWPKIKHIPEIYINTHFVFNSWEPGLFVPG